MKKIHKSRLKNVVILCIFFFVTTFSGYCIRFWPSNIQNKSISSSPKNLFALYQCKYGNFEYDSGWYGWKIPILGQENEFLQPLIHSPTLLKPKLGFYSTNNDEILIKHMEMLKSAKIQGIIINWTKNNNGTLPKLYTKNFTYNFQRYMHEVNVQETYINMDSYPFHDPIENLINIASKYNISVGLYIPQYTNRSEFTIIDDIKYFIQISTRYNNNIHINDKNLIMIEGFANFSSSSYLYDTYYIINYDLDCNYVYSAFQSLYSGFTCFDFDPNYFKNFRTRDFDIIPIVMPGYNETIRDLRLKHKSISRDNGNEYIRQWKKAFDWGGKTIIINSFNNWIENTEIEDAIVEFHNTDLWMGTAPDAYIRLTRSLFEEFQKLV